jgi:LPS-assembly protein
LLPQAICDTLARSAYGAFYVNYFSGKLPVVPLVGCILLMSVSSAALASEEPGSPLACPDPAVAPVLAAPAGRALEPLTLRSRNFNAQYPDSAEAVGDVELWRGDQQLNTERLRYLPAGKIVQVPGPMIYRDTQILVTADQAEFNFLTNQAELSGVAYSLNGSTANGTAQEMLLDTGNRSFMRRMQFTTCPGARPEWLLTAKELEFRHAEGIGIARGAKLEFMDIPFLYLPWMSFPIDSRRKSGFLYPHASNANDNGFEIGIPWYWNIAPNRDATLTPRYFTDRGFMLTGELRNLSARSGSILEFDYLFDDRKTDRNRYHYTLHHDTAINRRWNSNVVVDRVSDDLYFQDFGLSLAQTARQYLRSRAGIDGGGRYWTFSLLADDFQVIDDSVAANREPYRRLPRIAYNLDRPLGRSGLQFVLESEVVNFDRQVGVTGFRSDFYPRLQWGMERYWGFLRSSLGYRHTAYQLDLDDVGGDSSPDRGTEIFTVDAGMYFEKTLASGQVQTLEPRVFYLYVPYENQDHLPDFDTAEFTFGFAQLFHTNRFTGADRQSDANRITLALGTRSLDPRSGRDRWSLNVGQIFHFDDLRVSLEPQAVPIGIDTSPLVAEFAWQPLTRFTGRIGVQWNWETRELDLGTFGVDYRSENGSRLGFEYRFRRDRLDQFDLRHHWTLNERWRALSRLKYSLEESDLLEAQAGIEYESCCWALRLIARRYLRSREGDERDALYIELNLKGLGSFGRQPPPLFYDEAE